MTEEPGEYKIGDGRYIIAINKRVAHLFILILVTASLLYWADATGVYPLFGKSEGVE